MNFTLIYPSAISSTCRIEIRLVFFVPFKTSRWLILSSDCQDIITTVIFSHQSLGTGNCRHLHILPGLWRHKHLQAGWHWRTEKKTPRVSWNYFQSHDAIECKLRISDGKQGRKWNEDRQFRSWQKKKNWTGFSSVMLIPLGMGLVLTIPSHRRIFTQGIFKNQAFEGKIQGIPTFN